MTLSEKIKITKPRKTNLDTSYKDKLYYCQEMLLNINI